MKELPITEDWKPNKDKSTSLKKIIFEKCKHLETLIINQAKQEKTYNINNFDSGVVIEEIIRNSIETLIPKRYKVSKGIVCDRDGKTSGEHDIIIFNENWFPYLTGNTGSKERIFFPIEGIYAIGEVKQTLTIDSLDEGLKKLVISQRLNRPRVGINRYTENRKRGEEELGISNPLFTFLIAIDLDENINFDDLFNRFFNINKKLYRQEMVRALCVLNEFFISWAVFNEDTNEYDIARFNSKEEELPIIPGLRIGKNENESSFYDLIMCLGAHLNDSILGSEDIYVAYGNDNNQVKMPPIDDYTIFNY